MTIHGVPTWIASGGGRQLAAWIHEPQEISPRGVLVLVPSAGRDVTVTYRSLRVLALEAAQAGFVVVRFALSGTGESSGAASFPRHDADDALDRIPLGTDGEHDWDEDLRAVLDYCEQQWQVRAVGGLGLRLGAALLGASTDPRWSYKLLWDGLAGKRYLRQGEMLRKVAVPGPPEPVGVEIPGEWYSPSRAAEIKALPRIKAQEWEPGAEVQADAAVFSVTSPENEATLLHEVASIEAVVPRERVREIVRAADALTAAVTEDDAAAVVPAVGGFRPTTEAVVIGPTGRSLTEEFVTLEGGIPAVVTRPTEPREGDSVKAAILVAAASEPKDGPTGLWTRSARELAERGVMVVRPERPDIGDLGDPAADRDPNPHTAEGIRAIRSAAEWAAHRSGDRPVTGIGLCTGAWLLLAAATQPGLFERVVLVNNINWRDDLDFQQRVYDAGQISMVNEGAMDETAAAQDDRPDLTTRAKESAKAFLRGPAPYAVWRWLGRRSKADVPELMLAAADSMTEVLLIFGTMDRERFRDVRGEERLDALNSGRRRPIRVETHAELDHSLLGVAARRQTQEILANLGW